MVAFDVHFSGDWTVNADVGNGGTLKFDAITTNLGQRYNRDTGAFTAPYDGTYLFLLGIMGVGNVQVAIAKTGNVLLAITDNGEQASTLEVRDTIHSVVHLTAGEQVWAQHHYGTTVVREFLWTTFSGVLLHADYS